MPTTPRPQPVASRIELLENGYEAASRLRAAPICVLLIFVAFRRMRKRTDVGMEGRRGLKPRPTRSDGGPCVAMQRPASSRRSWLRNRSECPLERQSEREEPPVSPRWGVELQSHG